jgi:hypothetical protein
MVEIAGLVVLTVLALFWFRRRGRREAVDVNTHYLQNAGRVSAFRQAPGRHPRRGF